MMIQLRMYPQNEPDTDTSFSFSGHETFPLRYGWLKKGIDAASHDHALFSDERAMVKLGVGRNMVRSIRHWCLTAGLVQEIQRGHLTPTDLGRSIFLDDGFDPYLQDPATLWLIHWKITSNIRMATTWFLVFNYLTGAEFTKEMLVSEIQAYLQKLQYKQISGNTIARDVDCFIRTYVNSRQTKSAVLEDTLDCPLVDLRIISESTDGRMYQFQRGPQLSLPDEIFVFALLEFWRATARQGEAMAFKEIAYEPGSPGRIFKLDEDSLVSRLERIETVSDSLLTYDETAGMKQVYKRSDKTIEPLKLLEAYYCDLSISALLAS